MTTTTAAGGEAPGGSSTVGGGGAGGSTTTVTAGGSGGAGGGTGGTGGAAIPASCKEAQTSGVLVVSGVTTIDPAGDEGGPFEVYCDQDFDGGGWALVYNSVGDPNGGTTAFWNIPKAQSLEIKTSGGSPSLATNYYNGKLYPVGSNFRDVIIDFAGQEYLNAVQVKSNGFDKETMKFLPLPMLVSGSAPLRGRHYAGYWASFDFDGSNDGKPEENCAWIDADMMKGVSQHYNGCWLYNLGADFDSPNLDSGWGPHVYKSLLTDEAAQFGTMQFEPNPGNSGRVQRISRFTRW